MAMFKFCQECIALAENGLAFDAIKICGRCFEGRKNFVEEVQRDMAYRSHIARQMAGYPCDISSGCPHHPPSYQFYTAPAQHMIQYEQHRMLIEKALAKFRRVSHLSITALELLSGQYLSLVRYCRRCYNRAVDGIKQNLQVSLCNGCLTKRGSYIHNIHGHQKSFFEPWEYVRELPRAKGCVINIQIYPTRRWGYDERRDMTALGVIGGGGSIGPAAVAGLVFTGLAVPALIVSLASLIYNRRQWRLAQESQANGQAILVLSRLCSDLTNGRATITQQDVENASTSSFHTAETHPE